LEELMRKIALLAALVATVGAGVAQAQTDSLPRGGMRGRGGPGGPGAFGGRGGAGMLLRGITLTDAQKATLETLREQDRAAMEQNRDANQALFEQIRAARQSGDTATANRLMREQRTKMDAQRDKQAGAIRAILTSEQQAQFDKNLAEMKEMEAKFPGGRGRGPRPPGPPPPTRG
jgi:Spy/CpxP family protein refolding chaperone